MKAPTILAIAFLLSSTASWAQQPTAPAQAAPPEKLPAWLQYKPMYAGEESDIGNPHRTAQEITTWAQQAAADVLTFDRETQAQKMAEFKKYFNAQGWGLYTSYLKDNKILTMVNESGYAIGAVVTEVPEIINQGAGGGAYHWVQRMPITISFSKRDAATGEIKPGPSGKFYLFMDIKRAAQGGGDDGIVIDNWRVMDVPKN